jgi:hypothetical protein
MQVNPTRRGLLAGALAGAVIAGGAVGATAFGASSSSSTKSNAAAPAALRSAPNGTFKPIEAKAHEANEGAQREAQEDAGQFPTLP